jgi:ribokinase
VGEDDFGSRYIEHLQAEGIHTEAIIRVPAPTGSAFINVDDAGENSIIVNPGANHALQPHHLDAHAAIIRSASAVLLQLECPLPTVLHAVKIASAAGVPVILNPSPLTPEFIQTGLSVDTLIVNEHEAATLTGRQLEEAQTQPQSVLAAARCRQLIITRGGDSTLVITAGQTLSIAPPKVTPVDTVGAGDTFAGAFAVACSTGSRMDEAIRFANAAGALATQVVGAQPSIPNRDAILAFMARASGA